jgi:hypothetical protein
MDDFLGLIVENRMYLVIGLFAIWILYVLYHTGKLKKPEWLKKPAFLEAKVPAEQRVATAEAELVRVRKQNESLKLTIAKMKKDTIIREIIGGAQEDIESILPESLSLFDPENQLIGRPVYFLGNVPIINKDQALERIVEKHPLYKVKLFKSFTRKLMDWLYFQGDTAYFYSAQLLPNGKWVITATSKPSKRKGNIVKLPRYCKQFILLTSGHEKIDDLILNTWEVTRAKAAIELSSTFLGPFPIEEFSQVYAHTGWDNK